ncbi:MAG: hypothetical protein ABJN65_00730 [Parasphingorhabdus sp.]
MAKNVVVVAKAALAAMDRRVMVDQAAMAAAHQAMVDQAVRAA